MVHLTPDEVFLVDPTLLGSVKRLDAIRKVSVLYRGYFHSLYITMVSHGIHVSGALSLLLPWQHGDKAIGTHPRMRPVSTICPLILYAA